MLLFFNQFVASSFSHGCWSIWCYIGFNTSDRIGVGMCICRCYYEWIDHYILHCNTSESCIRCKYRINYHFTIKNEIPSNLGKLQVIHVVFISLSLPFSPQLREIAVAVGGGAIVFAVTTLLCVKFVTIVASSIVGSTMIMSAIDFFMHGSDTIQWVCFHFDFNFNKSINMHTQYVHKFMIMRMREDSDLIVCLIPINVSFSVEIE